MELEEYKIAVRQRPAASISQKGVPELEGYMRQHTRSVVDTIKNNLKLEIAFACLFLIFDGYVFLFSDHLRLFTSILFLFCTGFTYYLLRLRTYIKVSHNMAMPVTEQLELYINIISRFTKSYFQLTMIVIPLIFLLAFISGLLDQSPSSFLDISVTSQRLWVYLGISALWSFLMYFFTRWYVRKLYGSHLEKLKDQLRELQAEK